MALIPTTPTPPRFFVDGTLAKELARDLESLCVHVVDGKASAEVVLVGALPEYLSTDGVLERASLTIWLSPDAECFAGLLGQVEARILDDVDQRTVLFASGTSPEGSGMPTVPLQFGADVVSGSVRRGAESRTAHVVSTVPSLRWNSRISLTTPEPSFDGHFQIVELWYRLTLANGLRVELIGEALR